MYLPQADDQKAKVILQVVNTLWLGYCVVTENLLVLRQDLYQWHCQVEAVHSTLYLRFWSLFCLTLLFMTHNYNLALLFEFSGSSDQILERNNGSHTQSLLLFACMYLALFLDLN